MAGQDRQIDKATQYLQTLCDVRPNRRTGSSGNRDACKFIASVLEPMGYALDTTPFPTLDHVQRDASLTRGDFAYEIAISPYSLACDVTAELVTVSTLRELEHCQCRDKILLMKGDLCVGQLMPKNFVFYNPDSHKTILSLLEQKRPSAIVTATKKNPELVGALDPFPLIVDGDFSIPCAFCTDIVGSQIATHTRESFVMRIDAERIEALSWNVLARKHPYAEKKIVITAHMDAYEDVPGACDNASGVVVLLLLAERLTEYEGPLGIEILAFNGEDHYSAAGQMDYLKRYGQELEHVLVAINIDDAGYVKGRTAYSFYECPSKIQQKAGAVFSGSRGLMKGEPWPNGDHMVFAQHGVPAIAHTSECLSELMSTITHTHLDTPAQVDCAKLVELARALDSLVQQLSR